MEQQTWINFIVGVFVASNVYIIVHSKCYSKNTFTVSHIRFKNFLEKLNNRKSTISDVGGMGPRSPGILNASPAGGLGNLPKKLFENNILLVGLKTVSKIVF